MVRRGLADSRSGAQALIAEGVVKVRGIPTPKPASLVTADTPIAVESGEVRWVSRGARKLLAALDGFAVDAAGKSALDVGSSTGGFTQALLEAGAREVVALDVGRAQLHETLRSDPRVKSLERTNFRNVSIEEIGGPFQFVVADVSFISLCALAVKLAEAATAAGDVILLIKPQFEASRKEVGRGGVVRDQAVRDRAVRSVIECLTAEGLNPQGIVESPIKGSDGNLEYLLWLRKDREMVDLEVPH